jgi:tetratricopeptide (TPR) repeat protein
MMLQSISLCMITKDDGKNLETCLNSVKDIVAEIIIVDTGSKDNNKKTAKKFGAKVFDFKWTGDISAARNESLKHARKEWILVLDAGDELDDAGRMGIKDLTQKKNDAYVFITKNYTNDASTPGFILEEHIKNRKKYAGFYATPKLRLFRNRKGFKFTGALRESISSDSKSLEVEATNIIVHHYGYSDAAEASSERKLYLEICRKKVKEEPDSASCCQLGMLEMESGEKEKAINSFKKSVEMDPRNRLALYQLGILHQSKKDYDSAINYYTESLRVKNDFDAYNNLGVCYLRKGMLKEANRNFKKALLLNKNKHTVYNNLGSVLEKMGKLDNAFKLLVIGIKLNPNNVAGYYNLGIVLDKMKRFEDAVTSYEKAIELGHKNKDKIKERVEQIKNILASQPNYNYEFKVGG